MLQSLQKPHRGMKHLVDPLPLRGAVIPVTHSVSGSTAERGSLPSSPVKAEAHAILLGPSHCSSPSFLLK